MVNSPPFRGSEESLYLPDVSNEKKVGQHLKSCILPVLKAPVGAEKTADCEWLYSELAIRGS